MWMCWLPAPLERQAFRPDLDLTVVVQLGITFLDGLRQFFFVMGSHSFLDFRQ